MHQFKLHRAGDPEAKKVLIMIHGRGGSADDILMLASHLKLDDFQFVAPEATNNTWYPYSFLAPQSQNQPWLDAALNVLDQTRQQLHSEGFADEQLFFLGFSQGACLTLEYVTRHPAKFGSVIAFTGGLIGDELTLDNYKGSFGGTKFFTSTGDPDPHVPVTRVNDSVAIFERMGATVFKKIFPGRPHTIIDEEIQTARAILNGY